MIFSTPNLVALLLIVFSIASLYFLTRRYVDRSGVGLRNIKAYEKLQKQAVKAMASGRSIHFSPGRGSLSKATNPTSLAGLSGLQRITEDASSSDKPPLVSAGDGTLFMTARDVIRGGYEHSGRAKAYESQKSQFIAADNSPMAFGAGVSDILNQGEHGSSIIMGHIGSELALMAEAAERKHQDQIIGSDNLAALAVAVSATEDVLMGEELYAAAAYLQEEPAHIASLQLQDILRILVALGILIAAIVSLFPRT
ncbi:MAG TPA: DUF6754 domain-containing protein [candidate division Zixibacteria bacterium]|nr:DUF6754 domain-containing protein [candidate division Zixibacteria bacterium]